MNNNLSLIKIPLTRNEYFSVLGENVQLEKLLTVMNNWLNDALNQHKPLLGEVPQLSSLKKKQFKKLQVDLLKFINKQHRVHSGNKWIVESFFEKKIRAETNLFNQAAPSERHGLDPKPLDQGHTGLISQNSKSIKKIPRESNKPVGDTTNNLTIWVKLKNVPQLLVRYFIKFMINDKSTYLRYKRIISEEIEKKVGPEQAKKIEKEMIDKMQEIKKLEKGEFNRIASSWPKLKAKLKEGNLANDLSVFFARSMLSLVNSSDLLTYLAISSKICPSLKKVLQEAEAKVTIIKWLKKNFDCCDRKDLQYPAEK